MKNNHILTLENVSIGYQTKGNSLKLHDSLNAHLKAGELTCLLGPNGAGKSTLLRTLCGFQPSLGGEINIKGKNLSILTETEISRIISVVLTEKIQVYNLTVFDMVSLGRSPYTGFFGNLSSSDKNMVKEAISLTGINTLQKRMFHTLSDGEKQKVMIAKALVQETPLIFLDEPTAFLDLPSKIEVMQLLHQLANKTGKSIFLSTHDLDLALQTADRIWLMAPGHPLQTGSPEDLVLHNRFKEFFQRDGIAFDNKTGLFKIQNHHYRKVSIKGHGFEYTLLRKAFSRNGIDANPHNDSDIKVEIISNNTPQFKVFLYNQPIFQSDSIEEIIKYVKETESTIIEPKVPDNINS